MKNLQGEYNMNNMMHKHFRELKHFDMTTMGYYAHMEWENYDELAHNFNNITYWNGYINHYLIDKKMKPWLKPKKSAPCVFRYFKPNNERTPTWQDYRIDNFIGNLDDEPQLFIFQSETRKVLVKDIILFLEFPIWYFRDEIKNSFYGEFEYDIIDKFFKRWDKEDNTHESYKKLSEEMNEKYPKNWNLNLEADLHASFRKYGQLNIPVIDRPYGIFQGSSHTLFHACYQKWDTLKVFIKVPYREDFHKYPDEIVKGWYTYIAPNNFSPGHYKDGKFFYMLYIDIENEKIYAKKYDVSKFEELSNFCKNPTKKQSDLYKEFELIEK